MFQLLFMLPPEGYRKQQLAILGLLAAVGIIVLGMLILTPPINLFELAFVAAAPGGVVQTVHMIGNVNVHKTRGGRPETTKPAKDGD